MERVKLFVEKFVEKEAEVATRLGVPDLESYNRVLQEYYTFLVTQLQGATGYMPLTELRDEEIYEGYKGYPDRLPRHVYKISEYTHEKYGKVWVVYTSQENPIGMVKRLNNALMLIEEENQFKIARFLLYTNYTERGNPEELYRWDEQWGYRDLTFDSLTGPTKVERILEPSEKNDGLKMYLEEK